MHFGLLRLTVLLGALLWPVTSLALDASDLARVIERIAQQYDALDANMLQQPYRTLARVERPNHDSVEQLTDFDPDRPSGEKEQLIAVNNEPPDQESLSEFARRPQPDERDNQRIRLRIDYGSLRLTEQTEEHLVFQFQPILLVNGREDRDGRRFTGTLIYNLQDQYLEQVKMQATETFNKMLFRIRTFDVAERFVFSNGRLLRDSYYHTMDLSNPLINASNEIWMDFAYPSPLAVGTYPQRFRQNQL